jgi:RimJ/RimL family protein N-acetyltransferase
MSDTPWPPGPLQLPDEPLTDHVALLDRLVADDAEALATACGEAEIQRWLPFPDPYTDEDAREFIASLPELAARGERVAFALRPADSRALAGATGFSCGSQCTQRRLLLGERRTWPAIEHGA